MKMFFLIKKIVSKYSVSIVLPFLFISSSCEKMIEVDAPINEVVGKEIYNSNTTAASVLTGLYASMSNNGIFNGTRGISLRVGLSADELVSTAPSSDILTALYLNSLGNNGDQLFWSGLYNYIFKANSAIEGISASTGLTEAVRIQLIAEAKFVRAFMYFYLVNFYGDVPLLLTTDIKVNGTAGRTEKSKIYEQIIKDLIDARTDLSENYLAADVTTTTAERVRPNKSVASALLARVYLYNQQWSLAEDEATKLIDNTGRYRLEELGNVFLSQSEEAIFQLQPVAIEHNTEDAMAFVLADNGASAGPNSDTRPVYLSKETYNFFETGDERKKSWIDSVKVGNTTYSYPYKYKVWLSGQPLTEYLMVFRLAEQYLIRAEARTQLARLTGMNSAASDLNVIRRRAGLAEVIADSKEDMLELILKERRAELFTEWGHRWFDLKRTDKINEVMSKVSIQKGSSWAPYKALYPIPIQDIQRNPSLRGHQNSGYPEI